MFKFLVVSDTHFGFGKGTERENDCWVTVEEAITRAPEMGADFILIPGDVFDVKIPRPEDWARALELFSKSKVPIYATHGNHERRGQNLTNPVEGLHDGKVLTYVHGRNENFEVRGEKVSIYGLGWVPEAYSKKMFEEYNPKPVKGSFSVFIFHQSISPFIYNPMDPPSISLEDLPKGFDLYINGHIHSFEKARVHGKPFFIPGSSVTTQVNMKESQTEKGFVLVTVGKEASFEFIPFQTARKVFYKEIDVTGVKPSKIQEDIRSFLKSIPKSDRKPLVRVKLSGRLHKGFSQRDLGLKAIKFEHPNLILSMGSSFIEEFSSSGIDAPRERISIDEMGMKILERKMKENGIKLQMHDVFEMLVEGEVEEALAVLVGE